MVSLQLAGDRGENPTQTPSEPLGTGARLSREQFLVAFPGLDPWFKRRWSLPKVEARGKSFRNKYRWAVKVGVTTPVEAGGIARWELAVLDFLLDLSQNDGKTINKWTHKSMAGVLSCTPRSVKRWLDGLRARGWVEWCHNMEKNRAGQVRQLANSYVLLIPEWVQAQLDHEAGKRATKSKPGLTAPPTNPTETVKTKSGGVGALAAGATGLPAHRPASEAVTTPTGRDDAGGVRRSAAEKAAVAELIAATKQAANMKQRSRPQASSGDDELTVSNATRRPPP